ncbi:MAG: DMT family transporter [Candidatus Heimdallarchaeota archaeon]|nr:DMT family transporter [Candidatus Heimdallarchaeota archaeon]MCK4770580.1 DMT family transporter [Candidatus Heimdallarchaeota archaeon]
MMDNFLKNLSTMTKTRPFAIFQAFFVTILWSSSWPIIKFGLENENIPPFMFAGLRYVAASVILLVVVLVSSKHRKEIKTISKKWWLILIFYGLIFYTLTQGAQFLGLVYLPAITVSLLLSFTPILVLIIAVFTIKEKPSFIQTIFVFAALGGALLYFIPSLNLNLTTSIIIGLVVVIIGVLANAFSTIVGRSINQKQVLSPLVITAISMFIGSIVLLVVGFSVEGVPSISLTGVGYILWLSVVNTALAFTLWNHSMQRLRAVEISIINNTMLFQITILAVIFLSERPTPLEWVGLAIVAISGLLLPLFRSKEKKETEPRENNKTLNADESKNQINELKPQF